MEVNHLGFIACLRPYSPYGGCRKPKDSTLTGVGYINKYNQHDTEISFTAKDGVCYLAKSCKKLFIIIGTSHSSRSVNDWWTIPWLGKGCVPFH
jgi:hypothetical protein